MKLIIAGSRNVESLTLVRLCFKQFKYRDKIECVISGCARGVDRLGEAIAKENGLKVISKPANWDLHGKSAGYKRNSEMAEIADCLLAIWDKKSKGTKHMIDIALKKGIYVEVYDSFGRRLDNKELE